MLSTARLVPAAVPAEVSDDPQTVDEAPGDDVIIDRLSTVFLHAIAHVAGIPASRDKTDYLYHPQSASELDAMSRFSKDEQAELNRTFSEVAGTRLEEAQPNDLDAQTRRWIVNIKAAWKNRGGIADSLSAARPWEFLIRLSRLTTAAVSTLTLLLMTAEAWDLALSQSAPVLLFMASLVIVGTTLFVISRQNLTMRRHHDLREQLVVSRISALLTVTSGLAITGLGIHLLALCAVSSLFSAEVVTHWAASSELSIGDVDTGLTWRMATLCATFGLLIGSLGASFEDQWHFQHVIFVDEEL